jgi:hypothetical protein
VLSGKLGGSESEGEEQSEEDGEMHDRREAVRE